MKLSVTSTTDQEYVVSGKFENDGKFKNYVYYVEIVSGRISDTRV